MYFFKTATMMPNDLL